MAGKIYFYTDRGVTKRYAYCTRCGRGPFKETDRQIHKCGEHIYHCQKCLIDLGIRPKEPTSEPVIETDPEDMV